MKTVITLLILIFETSANANLNSQTYCFNDQNGVLVSATPKGIRLSIALRKAIDGKEDVEITTFEDYDAKKTDFSVINPYSLTPKSGNYVVSYESPFDVRDGSVRITDPKVLKKAQDVNEKYLNPQSDDERVSEWNNVECLTSTSFSKESVPCLSKADQKDLTVKLWVQKKSDWQKFSGKLKLEESLKTLQSNFKNAGVSTKIVIEELTFEGVSKNKALSPPYFSGKNKEFVTGATNSVFSSVPKNKYKTSHMNVFLVQSLALAQPDGTVSIPDVVQGTANGINLPTCNHLKEILCLNGVILGANGRLFDTSSLSVGNRMTHEIGHYLGLYHVTGFGAQFGLKQLGESVGTLKNLMATDVDASEKNTEQSFSCKQVSVIKKHPLFSKKNSKTIGD